MVVFGGTAKNRLGMLRIRLRRPQSMAAACTLRVQGLWPLCAVDAAHDDSCMRGRYFLCVWQEVKVRGPQLFESVVVLVVRWAAVFVW